MRTTALQHPAPADLNLWYGDFQALKRHRRRHPPGLRHGADRPVGLRQDHAAALLQPHQRALRQRHDDRRDLDPGQEHLRRRRLAGRAAQDRGHGLSAAQSAADLDLRERGVRPARAHASAARSPRAERDELVRVGPARTCFCGRTSRTSCTRKATLLTLEQQQKLCIARLLPLKPRVILMDEPCSALDAEGTQAIETLIDDAARRSTRS